MIVGKWWKEEGGGDSDETLKTHMHLALIAISGQYIVFRGASLFFKDAAVSSRLKLVMALCVVSSSLAVGGE